MGFYPFNVSNSGISLSCCGKFYSGMFEFSLWDFILLVCVCVVCVLVWSHMYVCVCVCHSEGGWVEVRI